MNARIHKTEKRLSMPAFLKEWSKGEDGEIVLFYLQVNRERSQGESGIGAGLRLLGL